MLEVVEDNRVPGAFISVPFIKLATSSAVLFQLISMVRDEVAQPGCWIRWGQVVLSVNIVLLMFHRSNQSVHFPQVCDLAYFPPKFTLHSHSFPWSSHINSTLPFLMYAREWESLPTRVWESEISVTRLSHFLKKSFLAISLSETTQS